MLQALVQNLISRSEEINPESDCRRFADEWRGRRASSPEGAEPETSFQEQIYTHKSIVALKRIKGMAKYLGGLNKVIERRSGDVQDLYAVAVLLACCVETFDAVCRVSKGTYVLAKVAAIFYGGLLRVLRAAGVQPEQCRMHEENLRILMECLSEFVKDELDISFRKMDAFLSQRNSYPVDGLPGLTNMAVKEPIEFARSVLSKNQKT